MKKIISLIVSLFVALFSFAGCNGESPSEDLYKNVDKSLLFGIDEPISEGMPINDNYEVSQVSGFSLDATVHFVSALGAKSFRFRIPQSFLATPYQYSASGYEYFKSAISKFHEKGVTNLIGNACLFPQYTAFHPDSASSAPRPDDPNYGEWLDAVSDMWEKLAKLFPEITKWEVGNESNSNTFFHPNGYQAIAGSLQEGSGGFTAEEQVTVVTDYMYYARKGIKKGNPNAECVMPGLAPLNGSFLAVQYFLADVYDYIKTGNAPYGTVKSTDPDDYFDYLGWHPYGTADEDWLDANNKIYQVAIDNGDEGKPVIFTEFGYSDGGVADRETVQIEYIKQAFEYMKNDMKYVETCCEFRLYTCAYAANWGGQGEVYFGCIAEASGAKGLSPRAKAYAIQEIFGGTGDLTKYE